MSAMVCAPQNIGPAMENVLRVWWIAVVIVTLHHILTRNFMIAMERAPINISLAMENVLKDMLSAMVCVRLKMLLTQPNGIVEANVLRSLNSVMEHALKEEQSVETTSVSAVMTIPTAALDGVSTA